ncbi:aminoglycoside phosphotransferase family protein [Candidatus Peregrinibacteria bacterium]|nr:aminoglycoside phosphotransferase family protein [Candidatus Peregrinibacteria bacterium]
MEDGIREVLRFYKDQLYINEVNGFSVTLLNSGQNHHIYLADAGNKQFIFRISFREELEASLKKEFDTLKTIPANLGPEAYIFDDSKKLIPKAFMIQSFIKGQHVEKFSNAFLATHARKMADLHSKNVINQKPKSAYESFFERYDYSKKNQPELFENDLSIDQIATKIETLFSHNEGIFKNINNSYLIHGDLHHRNILLDGETIKYVDWEEARYGDNALDVATLLWFIELSPEQYGTYLTTYQEIIQDPSLEKRMNLWLIYKDFSLLLHMKWVALEPETRSISKTEDFNSSIKKIIDKLEARISLFTV